MKILFLTHRMPYPPTDGARVRAFHCLEHFRDQGHEVTVACPARNDEEMAHSRQMTQAETGPLCRDVIAEPLNEPIQKLRMVSRLLSLRPSSEGYFHSGKLAKRIRQRLTEEKFDLIFVHCSSVGHYVEHVSDTPKFMDFVDMDSQKWLAYAQFQGLPKSPGYWLEGVKLQRVEKQLAEAFDMSTVVTPGELDDLQRISPATTAKGGTGWYSNGVKLEEFNGSPDPASPETLVFVGRMDYFPNQDAVIWFADEVLPLIRAQHPKAHLLIVGSGPTAAVNKLGERKDVTVTGRVDKVEPYILDSGISIAPLKVARGIQNKILEAMALGVPVVASTLSAKGVDAQIGTHLLAADSAEEWRDRIVELMDSPEHRETMIQAARERVETHHSWATVMEKMDGLIKQCLELHKKENGALRNL